MITVAAAPEASQAKYNKVVRFIFAFGLLLQECICVAGRPPRFFPPEHISDPSVSVRNLFIGTNPLLCLSVCFPDGYICPSRPSGRDEKWNVEIIFAHIRLHGWGRGGWGWGRLPLSSPPYFFPPASRPSGHRHHRFLRGCCSSGSVLLFTDSLLPLLLLLLFYCC